MISLSRVLCGIPEGMLPASELQTIAGHRDGNASEDYAAQLESITMVEFTIIDEANQVFTPVRAFFSRVTERHVGDDDLIDTARQRLAAALALAARDLRNHER